MSSIHHINTDLEIESAEDLSVLVEALGEDVVVLHQSTSRGFHKLNCEVTGLVADVDAVISHFCMFLEALSPEAKQAWEKAHLKKFDVGFQGGSAVSSYATEIRPSTVNRVASLGAGIAITIYPAEKS